jgi:methylmalonyl-CoA mutase N-terminal domain/subunit
MMVFCTKEMPLAGTPSPISGYHIREAGATAVQELAFTLADGIGYVAARAAAARRRRLRARCRSSSTCTTTSSRRSPSSARRAAFWARLCRDRFGSKNPRSWLLRTHAQDRGRAAHDGQQPLNNVVRTTMQALAAVLGVTIAPHHTRSTRPSR